MKDYSKKHQKITKRNTIMKKSDDFPVSEVSSSEIKEMEKSLEDSAGIISTEDINNSLIPAASLETCDLSDITSAPKKASLETCDLSDITSAPKKTSLEAEVVVHHLRKALVQIHSADTDVRTKILLDALIKIIIQNLNGLPDERDMISELIAAKKRILHLCFLLLIFCTSVVVFMNAGVTTSFSEPPPT